MGMPKIIYYRHKCIGCGICFEMRPDLWRISRRDGRAVLVGAKDEKGLYSRSIDRSMKESMEHTAAACPGKSIKVG